MALNTDKIAIELKDVSFAFESDVILENISLQIFEGEKVVLLGPSGQGKSVLLKLMAGLLSPTSGEVFIHGKRWRDLHGAEKQEYLSKIGMLFQKNALFDSLTVSNNVAFALRELAHSDEAEIQSIVLKFLDAVGILHAKDLFPDEISGGMQKRLGIARALALDPKIIFYDDPTAGLDPITSRKIIELILQMQTKSNATVVAVTNDMTRAYQLADRMVMVVDKSVVITGNKSETLAFKDPRVAQFIRGSLEGPLTESFE